MSSIRMRLLAGFSVVLALLIVSLLFAVRGIDGLNDRQHEVATGTTPYLVNLNQAALAAKAAATDERGYLLKGDAKFTGEFAGRTKVLEEALAAADAVASTDDERRQVEQIHQAYLSWVAAVNQEFELYKTDPAGATEVALGANRDKRKAYEGLFAATTEKAQNQLAASTQS